jgi:hypothetical protein
MPATRCPICGVGVLTDLAFDAGERELRIAQGPDSRQLETFSCGHEVEGAKLSQADDDLDVERRSTEETAEPLPEE